jgi:hypothetical protein
VIVIKLVTLSQLINLFAGLLVVCLRVMPVYYQSMLSRGTIYNDAASGLIWVENQVSLGANETIMGKACFKQWLWDMAYAKVKHYHGNNGIFSSEEYCAECLGKDQSQSFSGVEAQHQNA